MSKKQNVINAYSSKSDVVFQFFIILISIFVFIIVAYPLYFIVIASFSDSTLVNQGKVILYPKGFSTYGYSKIFEDTRILTGYKNTLIYTLGGIAVNLLFTLPAAYVLSCKQFRARKFIMGAFVFTMFFNGGLIPTYMLIKELHLIDNRLVMIIPFCVNVYNLIITRTFFEHTIPDELYEAAILDGCTHFRYFNTIVVPLSKAVISVIFLYYMVGHWNDFFNALLYLNKDDKQPLQIVLRNILLSNQVFMEGAGMGGEAGGYAQRYADQVKYGVIIVSTLPILCLYPFIQKYFEEGIMIGAIKG